MFKIRLFSNVWWVLQELGQLWFLYRAGTCRAGEHYSTNTGYLSIKFKVASAYANDAITASVVDYLFNDILLPKQEREEPTFQALPGFKN